MNLTPLQLKARAFRRRARAARTHNQSTKRTQNVTCSLDQFRNWYLDHADDPCCSCGIPSEHVDHIIPLVKGGAHGLGNFQMLCHVCNERKGHWLPGEVRTYPYAKHLRNAKLTSHG